jgi:cell volume regulation protein A
VPVPTLDHALLIGALVLFGAIFAVWASTRLGLPTLLLYLGIGMVLRALGLDLNDASVAQQLGLGALVVILAEGGLTTRWQSIRRAVPAAAVLSTVGVLVSVGVTAGVVRLALGVGWRESLLVGAVLAPTDAAAVFSELRKHAVRPRVVGILEAESGFNDAPSVILVIAFATAQASAGSAWHVAWTIVAELALGAVLGLLVGRLGAEALRRTALPASGLYPIAALAVTVFAYAVASTAHGSGFLAVYLAGLVLGNAELPHRVAVRGFAQGVGWLAQIGLFVLLGILAVPSTLPGVVVPAIVVTAGLILLARPLAVLASALPFRVPLREQAFLSWAGLRGAVPIVLATIPVSRGFHSERPLFATVFVVVVICTLVQGTLLGQAIRITRVAETSGAREVDVEVAPLERIRGDLLFVDVPERSRLHGLELWELRLPRGAAVSLIVRDDEAFVPSPTTRVLRGDELLIVTTARSRATAERRLRAVSRAGRLAGWYGERGDAQLD